MNPALPVCRVKFSIYSCIDIKSYTSYNKKNLKITILDVDGFFCLLPHAIKNYTYFLYHIYEWSTTDTFVTSNKNLFVSNPISDPVSVVRSKIYAKPFHRIKCNLP